MLSPGLAHSPVVRNRDASLPAEAIAQLAAQYPEVVRELIEGAAGHASRSPQSVDELVDAYAKELTSYQNEAYAGRYLQLVNRARNSERTVMPGSQDLTRAVVVNAFRLMAYKDEYEVARLHASDDFKASVRKQFDGVSKISVWLAPPVISRIDPNTGRPKKIKFGPWIFKAFSILAAFKGLRGGLFDPFGRNPERVAERALVEDYFAMTDDLLKELKARNHPEAVALASLAGEVRGFGPVKLKALHEYHENKESLLKAFRAPARIAITKAA